MEYPLRRYAPSPWKGDAAPAPAQQPWRPLHGGHWLETRLFRGLITGLAAACTLLVVGPALAHGEADDLLPPEPGLRLGAAAAVGALHAREPLPSQGLRGFLLQGDAGQDRRGGHLEHATATASVRASAQLGASLSLGKHGSDPAHVEAAWLQWRQDLTDNAPGDARWWQLTAGRQRPALGRAMGQAGHFDRFGLMPLAKQATLNGDWIDDGVELGWRQQGTAGGWRADIGLWRGQVFPGGQGASPVPSVHLGWEQGPWSLDGWLARFTPTERGSLVQSLNGHSHNAPDCAPPLKNRVCFGGASTVAGASAVWDGVRSASGLPWTFTAAGWQRQETGQLESPNGLARYHGRTQGGWLQALWQGHAQWEAGVRLERIWATQSLQGAGASLLALETGVAAYQPAQRIGALLAWKPRPWARMGLEIGEERGVRASSPANASARTPYVMLRLVLQD